MTCHHANIDNTHRIGPRITRAVCLSCAHEYLQVQDVGSDLDDVAARLDRFQVFGEWAEEGREYG